jgi:hypothetical protein
LGDEPFELKFKNNTFSKVQVRLSIDGTDILTALPATTGTAGSMWVVNGHDTLSLKAWPENSKSGASFVFTSAQNSVALHTHGDLSSRGIIAAAVFEEGYVEPIRFVKYVDISDSGRVGSDSDLRSYDYSCSDSITSIHESLSFNDCGPVAAAGPASAEPTKSSGEFSSRRRAKELQSLVAVGAGKQVEQEITYVKGLKQPILAETVKVRYLWWDELKAKLKDQKPEDIHPSGFPGDKAHKIISLGATPRIGNQSKKLRRDGKVSQEFSRF